MKKLMLLFIAWPIMVYGQNTMTFTFTGLNGSSYFQLESIKVKNLTQDCDTVLYYPDTTLFIYNVGIKQKPGEPDGFRMMQNYPNPVSDQTSIMIYVPRQGIVHLAVSDAMGRDITTSSYNLEKGRHSFIFTPPSEGIYFFNAGWNEASSSIKILAAATVSKRPCTLKYSGSIPDDAPVKGVSTTKEFLFNPGDELMLIGYGDDLESGFMDYPETSQDYVFQFATNIPCPGTDSLYYDGQWYHTIQIFSQCWMKENLNAGIMISQSQIPSDNGVVEKYCYAGSQTACLERGGLYHWEELMQYSVIQGGQGICPTGWHVPTDDEWKILEGMADSQYGIGHPTWDAFELRGFDVALNLKTTSGWSSNGNGTDLYGFAAPAGGYWWQNYFFEYNNFGVYWTSTADNSGLPFYRGMRMDMNKIARKINTFGPLGYSVRCLKD